MNNFTKLRLYHKAMQTKYSKLFLWTLVGFTIGFIFYLFLAHYSLIRSQEQIRTDYINHLQKADSLYLHWTEYNKAILLNSQKENNMAFTDSIIKSTLVNKYRLSRNQYNKLITVLDYRLTKIDALHKKYDEKLSRDSLRLNTERELLAGQTKTMLELHLNKIEHEYSSITMWGAVLTILFLVFSFYSIYKMDELIQQGNDGVKEIKHLKKEGKQDIIQIQKDKERIVTDIQGQLKETVNAMNNVQIKASEEFQERMRNMNSAKESLIADGQKTLDDFKKQFDKIIKKNNNIFGQKQKEFDNLIIRLNNILSTLGNDTDPQKDN